MILRPLRRLRRRVDEGIRRRRLAGSALGERVARVPMWWHSIDLGHGVVTPGTKPVDMNEELRALQLPDLRGKTVLDVGAWDGFYSFAAERLGAERVVAMDYFTWSIDREALAADQPQGPRGLPIDHSERRPGVWRPDTLPGKRGFDLAHDALGSRVESVVADFMHVDLATLGTFDVVLFLGVLYHLRHPLLALERLAAVTDTLAVIETEAARFGRRDARALCEFVEGDYKGDAGNWWVPNERAVVGLCRAAGFAETHVLTRAPRSGSYRLVVHAFKEGTQGSAGKAGRTSSELYGQRGLTGRAAGPRGTP